MRETTEVRTRILRIRTPAAHPGALATANRMAILPDGRLVVPDVK